MERYSCLNTGVYLRWPRVTETLTCQCRWSLLSEKWQTDTGVTGDLHSPCPRSAGQVGYPKHHRQQNTSMFKQSNNSFSHYSDQWENFSCLNIDAYIWCLIFEIHLTQTQKTELSTDFMTYLPSPHRCLRYPRPSPQASLDVLAIDFNPLHWSEIAPFLCYPGLLVSQMLLAKIRTYLLYSILTLWAEI